jgi:hypothetical protein
MVFRKNELQKIKIVSSKEKLTMAAGLGTMIELFDQTELKKNSLHVCQSAARTDLLEIIKWH